MSIVSLQLVRTWGSITPNDRTRGSITPNGSPAALQNGKLVQKPRANSLSRDFLGKSSDIRVDQSFIRDGWSAIVWHHVRTVPLKYSTSSRSASTKTRASASTNSLAEQSKSIAISSAKSVGVALSRGIAALQRDPLVVQCAPALALMAFSAWGLAPTLRFLRKVVKKKEDVKWSSSRTQQIVSFFLRPLFLWIGVILICRAFDPVVLKSEASQAIKGRFINFVRSLSTVLAFAFCTANFTQYLQKTMMGNQDKEKSRSIGVQFIGNTVYTSVWVAAVCLFMELLGFSTQKWITAGGFGTVLLTLAGREIFTNFLSSIMIHATRPFIENEWIQTKIEGQEVSGTVEHVGWWSPTVVRGDDREAVHIPNHKFTVSVVRNLSQKTHWRIKTHFGISHLDVGKVADIVSDMRKVISKHPQVEQQRLHRRAFFDNVDPENQSLLILVSCFVKTSHFEEYLRVKEIILLDMLRVISHHNARLATPIRSVQRIFDESEARQAPFRDESTPERKRPLYMIEASSVKVNDADGEDLIKVTPDVGKEIKEITPKDAVKMNAAKEIAKENVVLASHTKAAHLLESAPSDPKSKTKSKEKSQVISEAAHLSEGASADPKSKTKPKEKSQVMAEAAYVSEGAPSDPKSKMKPKEKSQVMAEAGGSKSGADSAASAKPQLEGLDSMGLNSNDITLLKAAFEKPPVDIPGGPVESASHADMGHGDKEQTKPSKAESSSPSLNAVTNEIPKESSEESVNERRQGDDPWREQPQVIAGVPQKSDSGQSGARSLEEKSQTAAAAAAQSQAQPTTPSAAPVPRLQSVQENLVLGVALDGPKRTLPLDGDIPATAKPRELVTSRNGSGSTPPKERRDPSSSPQQSPPGATSESRGERER